MKRNCEIEIEKELENQHLKGTLKFKVIMNFKIEI